MKLHQLKKAPGVLQATVFDPAFEVPGITIDSRRADRTTAFLALAGQRTDGHRYVDAALAAGAPVLLVSDPAVYARLAQGSAAADATAGATGKVPLAGILLIGPGRAVAADLAAEIYGHPGRSLRLLGVTGTSGKTTIVHLVGQLLSALGEPHALLGTQGYRIGEDTLPSERTTPEAADIQAFLRRAVDQGARTAAMEVTSIGIELERTRALPFAAAAFANLSQDHLDLHADMETYRETKFRLFTEYAPAAHVVNADDPAGRLLIERLERGAGQAPLLTVGLEGDPLLTLEQLRITEGWTDGQVRFRGQMLPFRYALPGRFNLSNLLVALGLLLASGSQFDALVPAIETCTGAGGRFERIPLDAAFTVLVDYAHKPDALGLVLQAARPLVSGRLRVLVGCGGDRDRLKRPLMGEIAGRLADEVVLSSDNPRSEDPQSILDDMARGMTGTTPATQIVERREAIRWLLERAGPGDVVLIAGKGDEPYQEIGDRRLPFDDREAVREWARERGIGLAG